MDTPEQTRSTSVGIARWQPGHHIALRHSERADVRPFPIGGTGRQESATGTDRGGNRPTAGESINGGPMVGSTPLATPQGGIPPIPATMNIAQAAQYLGIAKATLYTWRTRRPGFGPRAVRAGGALRYRHSDLEAWLEAHAEARDPAADADPEHGDQRSGPDSPTASRAPESMARRSGPRRR